MEEENRQLGIPVPTLPQIPPEIRALSTAELFERVVKAAPPPPTPASPMNGGDFPAHRELTNRKEEAVHFLMGALERPPNIAGVEPQKVRNQALNKIHSIAIRSPESVSDAVIAKVQGIAEGKSGEADAVIRRDAIDTLGLFGPRAAGALPLLKAEMSRGDWTAALAYCRIARSEEAIAEVLSMIKDPKLDVRHRSMLVEVIPASWTSADKSQRAAIERGLVEACRTADWRFERKIGMALLRCSNGGTEAQQIIQRLFKNPEQAKATGRGEYMDLSVAQLVEYIREPRMRDEDSNAASELRFHLPNVAEAVPALIAMLDDGRNPVSAVSTLGVIGKSAEPAVPALERFFAGDHPMRWMALDARWSEFTRCAIRLRSVTC